MILTKNHRRRFINADVPPPHNDNTGFGHEVFQITLKNSEKYVLDIAGAQYGQFTPVMPWDVYAQSHVKDVVRSLDFGSTRERMTSSIYCNGSTDIQLIETFNKLLSESMNARIKEWQDTNIKLPAMLKLSEQAHLQKRSEFFETLNGAVDEAKLAIHGASLGRARGPVTEAMFEQWLGTGTALHGA